MGHNGAQRYRADEIEALCSELLADDSEDEVVLRGRERWVGRITAAPLDSAQATDRLPHDDGFRVEIGTPGVLDTLAVRSMPRRPPGRGEVEIEVCAAGMNFKDILHAMGLLPGESM